MTEQRPSAMKNELHWFAIPIWIFEVRFVVPQRAPALPCFLKLAGFTSERHVPQ